MKSKKIILLASFILVSALIFFYWNQSAKVVVQVGDYKIQKKDVKKRNQIQNVFYPESKEDYGQQQLERAYIYAQILKNNGFEVTERILREEEIRIQQNTKDPKRLKQIQDLFGNDTEAYQKVFILPTYVERFLYSEYFLKNPNAQTQSLGRVRNFLTLLRERPNKSFQELAQESGYKIQAFSISEKGIIKFERKEKAVSASGPKLIDQSGKNQPPAEIQAHLEAQQQAQSSESARMWIEQVIPQLKAGDIIPEPVNFGEAWMAVRYVGKSGDRYQFQSVMFPKDDFNTWLEAEKAKVQIKK